MIDDVKFLEYVVKALVSYPDDIKIKRTVDEMGVLMTLDVHPDDMGKVIGRSGNTAKAIRILLRVVGMKNNASFYNPRDFVKNKWKKVDRPPYGGGPGLVIEALPVVKAIESVLKLIAKS